MALKDDSIELQNVKIIRSHFEKRTETEITCAFALFLLQESRCGFVMKYNIKKFTLHRKKNVTKIVTRCLEDKAFIVLFVYVLLRGEPSHGYNNS